MCLKLASNSWHSFSLSLSNAGIASVSLQAGLLSNLLCIYAQAPWLSPLYKGNTRKGDGLPKVTESQEKSELDSNVLEQILPQKKIKKKFTILWFHWHCRGSQIGTKCWGLIFRFRPSVRLFRSKFLWTSVSSHLKWTWQQYLHSRVIVGCGRGGGGEALTESSLRGVQEARIRKTRSMWVLKGVSSAVWRCCHRSDKSWLLIRKILGVLRELEQWKAGVAASLTVF